MFLIISAVAGAASTGVNWVGHIVTAGYQNIALPVATAVGSFAKSFFSQSVNLLNTGYGVAGLVLAGGVALLVAKDKLVQGKDAKTRDNITIVSFLGYSTLLVAAGVALSRGAAAII